MKEQNDPIFKEFLEFKARQGNTSQSSPSYVNVVIEEGESDDLPYEQNNLKDIILILEDKDLRWKDEIWHLMQRYLDVASFTAGSYKQRTHFENILKTTGSCEFSHFYAGKQTKAYSFSKVIIKQVISAEEWGISTFREREYHHPEKFQLNLIIGIMWKHLIKPSSTRIRSRNILGFSKYVQMFIKRTSQIGYTNGGYLLAPR